MIVGKARGGELEYDCVFVKLYSFDDSLLEVGEEEGFFISRVFDGFFVDAYDPEKSIDIVVGQGGDQFEDSFVGVLFFFLENDFFLWVVSAL